MGGQGFDGKDGEKEQRAAGDGHICRRERRFPLALLFLGICALPDGRRYRHEPDRRRGLRPRHERVSGALEYRLWLLPEAPLPPVPEPQHVSVGDAADELLRPGRHRCGARPRAWRRAGPGRESTGRGAEEMALCRPRDLRRQPAAQLHAGRHLLYRPPVHGERRPLCVGGLRVVFPVGLLWMQAVKPDLGARHRLRAVRLHGARGELQGGGGHVRHRAGGVAVGPGEAGPGGAEGLRAVRRNGETPGDRAQKVAGRDAGAVLRAARGGVPREQCGLRPGGLALFHGVQHLSQHPAGLRHARLCLRCGRLPGARTVV